MSYAQRPARGARRATTSDSRRTDREGRRTDRDQSGKPGRSTSRTQRSAGGERPAGSKSYRSTSGRSRRGDSQTRRPRGEQAPVRPVEGPNGFVDLGVPRDMAGVLAAKSITVPTPIQDAAIPAGLAGRDVLGRGQTGSGKTLGFGLPLLLRLAGSVSRPGHPRGLILAPTRELAQQVLDELRPLADVAGLRMQLVIGGSSYDRQIRGLAKADIVVATPGRLSDLIERGSCVLHDVTCTVLDEADQMADLGFLPQVDELLQQIGPDSQVSLFSATLDRDVRQLVKRYLHNPVEHSTDPTTASVGTMEHHVVLVSGREKRQVASQLATRQGRTVAFVRTQAGAQELSDQLRDRGVRSTALHGGMSQKARNGALHSLREGRVDILVATDVAARGLHVDGIDLVLQVDPPHGPKDYLHRAGRTARAGAHGRVVTIATHSQKRMMAAITGKAGVNPDFTTARPGDAVLTGLSGPVATGA